jgi:hypothetical protein
VPDARSRQSPEAARLGETPRRHEKNATSAGKAADPREPLSRAGLRPGGGSNPLTSRSSVGRRLRKCHWPGYPYASGKRTDLAAESVEGLEALPTSLMPEQVLRDLTAQQAADLLAYLQSLRWEPRRPSAVGDGEHGGGADCFAASASSSDCRGRGVDHGGDADGFVAAWDRAGMIGRNDEQTS